jgi:hypothetical protein
LAAFLLAAQVAQPYLVTPEKSVRVFQQNQLFLGSTNFKSLDP